MIALTLLFMILGFDRTEFFLKPALSRPFPVYLLMGLVISAAVFMLLLFLEKRMLNMFSKHGPVFLAVLSVLLFIAELIFTFSAFFYSDWDPAGVLDCVYKLLRMDKESINLDYFSAHPNNLMLVFIYLKTLFIGRLFGTESVLCLMVLQSLLFTLGGVLFCLIIRDLISEKSGLAAWFIYAIYIGFSPYILITYSDAMGLIFPLIMIRLFQCRERLKKIYPLLLGVAAAFGYAVKPQTVIVFIAICMLSALYMIVKRKPEIMAGIVVSLICTGLSLFLISAVLYPSLGLSLDKKKSFGFSHYLMMGLNPETDGVYSDPDTEFTNAAADPSERQRENLRVAGERIRAYGIKGMAGHLMRKQLINFSDGTFSWGIDGNFFAGPKLGDMPEVRGDSPLRPLILSFLVTGEKNNGHFRDIMQIFWLTVLFFGGVGELFLLKRIKEGGAVDDPSFQVMALSLLSILGLMMFELLFEAKARYLFTYLPVFLIPGVYGAVSLFRKLSRRLSS